MKAVIFDFDGTIVDSLAGVIKVYEQIGRRRTPMTLEQRKTLQNKDLLQIAVAMKIPKWQIGYLAIWGRRMFHHHMRSVQVHPGMSELIQELNALQIPLYVVSANRAANVEKYLEWHGLDQYFTRVYGGASFFNKSRTMKKLLKHEKADAAHTWCIGDEKVDIRSARAAGLKIIAVSWGYNSREDLAANTPDALVDSPAEIRKILDDNGIG
jgi:phosphoglycolate phosphatase-like HAD superfamily hydrolase